MNTFVLWGIMNLLAASLRTNSQPHSVIMPAVRFVYADPEGWDTFSYDQPIRIEVNVADVGALSRPRVRLFSSRYVQNADQPVKLTLQKVNGCGVFHSRSINYMPTVSSPNILLGRLPKTDFRCVNDRLQKTDFYLVIEQGGTSDSIVRVNLDAVDEYFASAYRFTVKVPPDERCSSGTENADKADREERNSNRGRYLAARRRSEVEKQKIAVVDTKAWCIDTVKESDAALLSLGVVASIASNSDGNCCEPRDH